MLPLQTLPRHRCATRQTLVLVLVLLLATVTGSPAIAGPVTGVGVMGDSVADEYQFPQFFPPGGDRRFARNFVEIVADTRGLDFGDFSINSRGSPRNQGYANNWALDGSTSSDLITGGQHTGLAQQIAAAGGDVNLAWLWIGGNDFRGLFAPEIIQAPDPGASIQSTVVTLATNVQIAIQTVLAANPQLDVVVANVPDLRALPAIKAAIAQTPELALFVAGVDQGIQAYNAQVAALAAGSDRIALVDAYRISQPAAAGLPVQVGSLLLDTNVPGNDLESYFVDVLHPGTVSQGLLANAFIDAGNAEFHSGIARLSDHEIVAYAAAVPLPEPLSIGVIGLVSATLAIMRSRRRQDGRRHR